MTDIRKLLFDYKKEYDFLAQELAEAYNIQQAIIYIEKSKTIDDFLKEIKRE